MSEERRDGHDAAPGLAPGEDTRKEWVTPAVEELPINATQGAPLGIGADLGTYS